MSLKYLVLSRLNADRAPQLKASAAGGRGIGKLAAATSNYMADGDPIRTLRLIGAVAALLAVLGLAMLVFWFAIRFPRF